jgi:plasmid maintenance system antidote protein VapI
LPARGPETGPSTPDSPDEQLAVAFPPAPPRSLIKRLTPTDQADLITAFNAGSTQKTLAAKYGISTRSVKRLVHGSSNRPQATTNRLTSDQRAAIVRSYTTTGTTQAELARAYGVDTSTVKRILRQARSAEPGNTSA